MELDLVLGRVVGLLAGPVDIGSDVMAELAAIVEGMENEGGSE